MSIWGPGPFDNDDGADWFADFRDRPALQSIREALEEIADPSHVGYLDVTDAAEAVAAAEVLVNLLDRSGSDEASREQFDEFAEVLDIELELADERHIARLAQQAIDVIEIVLNDAENSELRQMWEEQAEDMPAWMAVMRALQQRLHRFAVP